MWRLLRLDTIIFFDLLLLGHQKLSFETLRIFAWYGILSHDLFISGSQRFFGSHIFSLPVTPRKIPCLPARKSLPLPVTQEFFILPVSDVIGCHHTFQKNGKWCFGVVNWAKKSELLIRGCQLWKRVKELSPKDVEAVLTLHSDWLPHLKG